MLCNRLIWSGQVNFMRVLCVMMDESEDRLQNMFPRVVKEENAEELLADFCEACTWCHGDNFKAWLVELLEYRETELNWKGVARFLPW